MQIKFTEKTKEIFVEMETRGITIEDIKEAWDPFNGRFENIDIFYADMYDKYGIRDSLLYHIIELLDIQIKKPDIPIFDNYTNMETLEELSRLGFIFINFDMEPDEDIYVAIASAYNEELMLDGFYSKFLDDKEIYQLAHYMRDNCGSDYAVAGMVYNVVVHKNKDKDYHDERTDLYTVSVDELDRGDIDAEENPDGIYYEPIVRFTDSDLVVARLCADPWDEHEFFCVSSEDCLYDNKQPDEEHEDDMENPFA